MHLVSIPDERPSILCCLSLFLSPKTENSDEINSWNASPRAFSRKWYSPETNLLSHQSDQVLCNSSRKMRLGEKPTNFTRLRYVRRSDRDQRAGLSEWGFGWNEFHLAGIGRETHPPAGSDYSGGSGNLIFHSPDQFEMKASNVFPVSVRHIIHRNSRLAKSPIFNFR